MSETATIEKVAAAAGPSLKETTVVLNLKFRAPGLSRKGDLGEITTKADKSMLRLSQDILDSDEYAAIKAIATETRGFVKRRAVPAPMLRTGMYRLGVAALPVVYERVKQAEIQYAEKVEEFIAAYPALKADAKKRLGPQYRETNYPQVEDLEKSFDVKYCLIDFGTPSSAKVGEVIGKAEWQKAKAAAAQEAEECKLALRAATLKIVEKFAAALGTKDSGRKGSLTAAGWDNVKEFLDLFAQRNVLQDDQCAEYVAQLKSVLDGNDIELLRKKGDVRAKVEATVSGIAANVSKLVEAPKRAISFDDV